MGKSQQPAEDLKAAFREFDENGDGTLDKAELIRVFRACDPSMTDAGVEVMLKAADKNGDNMIDYDEFIDWLAADAETAGILGLRAMEEEVSRSHQREYADSKQEIEALHRENEELRRQLAAARSSERQLRATIRDMRLAELDRSADKKAQRHAHEKAKQHAKESFLETFDPVLRDLIDDAGVIQQEANALDDELDGPFTFEQRQALKDIASRYDALAQRAMQELHEDLAVTAREKVRETEEGFRQVYVSILDLIRNDEQDGYQKVVELLGTLPSKSIHNSVSDVADLVDEAAKAQPRVSELAESIGTQVDAVKLQDKPVKTGGKRKKLGRIQEKLNNAALERQNAARVYDCARAMLEFDNMEALHAALEKVLDKVSAGTIAIDRVKDRFSRPSGGGWADAMVNFHFLEGEAAGHVCEFQFVHSKLLLARAGLGGHDAYGAFRATLELLELLGDVEAACRADPDWTASHILEEYAELRAQCQRPATAADSALVEAALQLEDERWPAFLDLLGALPGGSAAWSLQLAEAVAPRDFPAAAAFAQRCGVPEAEVRSLQQRRGGFVTSSLGDQTARSWDALTGMELQTYEHDLDRGLAKPGTVEAVALSPDGKFVYTTYNQTTAREVGGLAKKWEVATGEEVMVYDGNFTSQTRCLALSADGRNIFIGGNKGQVKQLDEETGEVLADWSSGFDSDILELAVSADGYYLYTAHNSERMVKKFDLNEGPQSVLAATTASFKAKAAGAKPLLTFTGHAGAVVGLTLSADGRLLATSSTDGRIFVWDVETGDFLQKMKPPATTRCMAFTTDGKYLWAPGKNHLEKWDTETGKRLATFKGHAATISCVAVSGDDAFVYTGSQDKTAKKWDAATGKCILTFSGHAGGVTNLALPAW